MHSVGWGWPRRGRPRAVGGGGRVAGTQQPRPAGPFVWKPECCASLLHRVWDLGATCRAIQQWVWAVRRTWGSPSWSSLRLFSSIRRWRSSSYSVSVMAPQFPARFGTAQAAGALICPNQLSAAAVSARKRRSPGCVLNRGGIQTWRQRGGGGGGTPTATTPIWGCVLTFTNFTAIYVGNIDVFEEQHSI